MRSNGRNRAKENRRCRRVRRQPESRRLSELPADQDRQIIGFGKISLRGYEAALTIEASGYTSVKVMEGGILA